MALSSYVYISFPGTAAEAFPYYRDVFGGELSLQTYGDADFGEEGMDMPFEPDPGAVAHAQLEGPGLRLAGGDYMGEKVPSLTNDVYSLLLVLDSVDEGRTLFDRLVADGGTPAMPFAQAPWGDHYGQVHDRFGLRWDVDVPATT